MTEKSGTILALDVGEVRIGAATANLASRLPQPWGVIEHPQNVADIINSLITEHNIVAIVVGLPRGLDGQETPQTKLVRAFTDKLKQKVHLPFYFQDEALTSVQAEQELNQTKTKYNKGDVDALAATYILSDFLLEHREF